MAVEIITKEDLENFRLTLLGEIKDLLSKKESAPPVKEWLRSAEVLSMLGISMGTLQNLCINGILHPTKVGGLNFFKYEEIQSVLNK